MAIPTWPTTLPQFVLRGGYTEGFQNTVLFSPTDSGRTKRRQRFLNSPRELNVIIPMDNAELAIFTAFLEEELAGGALSFSFPHPRLGTTVTVAMKEVPDPFRPEGALTYLVALKLEILP